MEKKEYFKPTIQVIYIAAATILTGSTTIGFGEGDADSDACSKNGMIEFDDMDEEW